VTGPHPLAVIENLSVSFPAGGGTTHAVRDVSLTLGSGECLALVGESGSGKSVTARSLIGLVGARAAVRAARLTFEEHDLRALPEARWRRLRGRRIGYVLQDALTSLDPLRRIADEVGEPMEIHGIAAGPRRDQLVLALLADAGIPDPQARARQYPHELSGGLRQRALVASALAARPSLLIADEPTASLDATVRAQLLDLLAANRDTGTSVLLISHDMAVVSRMADRIAVMYAGLVMEQGPAAAVLAGPAHPYTADLLAAVPSLDGPSWATADALTPLPPPADGPGCPYANRCHRADDRCRGELPPPAEQEHGVAVRCWHPGPPRPVTNAPAGAQARAVRPRRAPGGEPSGPALLSAEKLTRRFRSLDGTWRTAVDGVSFTLAPGEALGMVGESGSGKTTIARMTLGLLAPDAGTVVLDGQPWSALPERRRRPRRQRIQFVGQDVLSSFDPRFTVERIVAEGLGRPGRVRAGSRRDRVTELLAAVGLDQGMLTRRATELSGGQRQRVAIARALAPGPGLIVCDEPVSALDASVQARILALLARLRASEGVALLFISHDLGVIRQVCDRVIVLKDGVVVEEGAVDTVFADPRQPYTQTLLEAAAPARPTGVTGPETPANS
jgi:peptide/nickel transport system ATP-binding protein